MTDLIRRKHETFNRSQRKEWIVSGEYGSLSFWVEPNRLEDGFYGGVESHYNYAPKYMEGKEPNKHCNANGGVCWHDGTSLWASEYWIPRVLPLGDEAIFRTLERYYDERLNPNGEK